MKVAATNLGEPRSVVWNEEIIETGIYKYPVENGVVLGYTDVDGDAVVDRKYHGGVDKACYLYSADVYDTWKKLYPDADWSWGMFGENLTIHGLDERNIYIGDVYRIGEALVEVSEPREPCFKLGIRFGTQAVLKSFVNQPHCGVYVRVLEQGKVLPGDTMVLVERMQEEFSMSRIYWLRYHATVEDIQEIERALGLDKLADSARGGLKKRRSFLES